MAEITGLGKPAQLIYGLLVVWLTPGRQRERAGVEPTGSLTVAEGENTHNLSGKRTVGGKTLWKVGFTRAEGVRLVLM